MTSWRFLGAAIAASVATLLCGADAGPASDAVSSLPGWSAQLPSRWWSGFLKASPSKSLHYVLVEAEESPATKPVVLWLNGGPGCSSLDGLFYEHGPLLINQEGTKLSRNPYAWTTVASVLYLESPAGVGFSWSTNPKEYVTGDLQTALDNLAALKAFFAAFPELASNDFYVSGESYGGVYVPTLSQKIFESGAIPNMKGFLVGNGVFGGNCSSTFPEFLYGHGAISRRLRDKIAAACDDDGTQRPDDDCEALQEQAESMVAGLNPYDFYRDCYAHAPQSAPLGGYGPVWRDFERNPAKSLPSLIRAPRPAHPAVQAGAGMNVPCINSDGGTKYLGRADVKAALNVADSPNTWSICSEEINEKWNPNGTAYPDGMVPVYQTMLKSYRIVVYNGDVDPGCNYVGNENCVSALGTPIKVDWRPWSYTDRPFPADPESGGPQTGGWVTEYDTPHGLFFLTVKGAGHMSPQWKPLATISWLARFLNGSLI